MDVQSPETPGRFSLRLDVYSPPQVLQIYGRLCHLVLAFPYVGDIANGRATSLRGHYSASSLLRAQPPPSRLRPTSRFRRLYGLPCSDDFAPGRGGLLQLLNMSLSPCCHEVGPDAVLASACLPLLFQAIEIDGEHYWDGGYMGNPAIFPLIYSCDSRDVVIVHINPIERPDVPKTAGEILNRINEISFNSSLMREMRTVYFVTKLIEEEKILDKTIRRMLIHSIEADDVMQAMGVRSKSNADRDQINSLMKVGRERADAWLAANFDRLGKQSTIDIHEKYL